MNFSWVIEGKLAGMGRPGFSAESEREVLTGLARRGVGAVVSLTEAAPSERSLRDSLLRHLHVPIADFGTPAFEDVERIAAFVEEAWEDGLAVAVHCAAGLGRTGTVLACLLVKEGRDPDVAISEVRRLRPGSIETASQARVVHAYAEALSGAHD